MDLVAPKAQGAKSEEEGRLICRGLGLQLGDDADVSPSPDETVWRCLAVGILFYREPGGEKGNCAVVFRATHMRKKCN